MTEKIKQLIIEQKDALARINRDPDISSAKNLLEKICVCVAEMRKLDGYDNIIKEQDENIVHLCNIISNLSKKLNMKRIIKSKCDAEKVIELEISKYLKKNWYCFPDKCKECEFKDKEKRDVRIDSE